MDYKDSLKALSERIERLKDQLPTEEATKTALILPFISLLGYDIFNPAEVLPEMSCDIGTKKGEKIDYAILKDGSPVMLIECKHWAQDLNLHDNQLLRYFNVSKSNFGVLTNGIIYRFYSDIEEPNKMDEKPFLEVNLLNLKDWQIEELKKFHKSYFDVDKILDTANELKYMGELKAVIVKEFSSPSAEFVKFFGKQVYSGTFTQKITEQFSTLVKRAHTSYINDLISERLNAAIRDDDSGTAPIDSSEQDNATDTDAANKNPKIVTTDDEIEAYFIVKSILRTIVPAERITYRDAQSYCAIFLDDNNRKNICRLYFNNPNNKRIAFLCDNHQEHRVQISSLDDIYDLSEEMIACAKRYL